MFKRKRFFFSLTIILTLLIITACGNDPESVDDKTNSDNKNVINVGVTYAPSNINPLSPDGLASTYVANLLFLPLVEVDSNLDFQPMLADSITTEDNLTFTITLNEDAKWTDGNDITTDDLIFTLDLMTDPEVASNYAYMFAIIEGIDDDGYLLEGETSISGVVKKDEKTIELTTKNPTTLQIFQDTIGRYLLTLPKEIIEDIEPSEINTSDFMQHPTVTSGPFTLSEIDRNHYVEMIPNENYFAGDSKLDQLNFKVLEGNQIAGQMKSGEIDVNIPLAGAIPVSDYEAVQNLETFDTFLGQPLATEYMYMNENVVLETKVRQAISYGINRELIVDNLLKGAGETTDGFFQSISPYFNEDITTVEYNPEKSKKLLAESGWDSNQILNLAVLSGDATLEQAANIIADNLGESGINVKIQMMDYGTILDEIVSMEYDLAILTVSMTPINPLPDIAYFLSEGNPNAYSNERVNEIIDALSTEADETQITALYKELDEITREEVPMPSIYSTKALGAVSKRVNGVTPSDYGMFINVHEWSVE